MGFVVLETRQSRAALFGRLCDALTRRTLGPEVFAVTVTAPATAGHPKVLKKSDGYFAFADLGPAGAAFDLDFTAQGYQARSRQGVTLLAVAPVELSAAGEDEAYLIVTGTDATENRVDFERLADVPRIATGAAVIGDGVATALAEPLEGRDQNFAMVDDLAGIVAGDVLRVVRSTRLLMWPDATAPVPVGTTSAVVTVVETDPEQTPIEGAVATLTQVNGAAPTTLSSAGLTLHRATDVGPPATTFTLGPASVLSATTDARGRAAFHFAGGLPVSALDLSLSRPGYLTASLSLTSVIGARTAATQTLTRA